jgi:hypothetical protein
MRPSNTPRKKEFPIFMRVGKDYEKRMETRGLIETDLPIMAFVLMSIGFIWLLNNLALSRVWSSIF